MIPFASASHGKQVTATPFAERRIRILSLGHVFTRGLHQSLATSLRIEPTKCDLKASTKFTSEAVPRNADFPSQTMSSASMPGGWVLVDFYRRTARAERITGCFKEVSDGSFAFGATGVAIAVVDDGDAKSPCRCHKNYAEPCGSRCARRLFLGVAARQHGQPVRFSCEGAGDHARWRRAGIVAPTCVGLAEEAGGKCKSRRSVIARLALASGSFLLHGGSRFSASCCLFSPVSPPEQSQIQRTYWSCLAPLIATMKLWP
jgi:hypothetical protein